MNLKQQNICLISNDVLIKEEVIAILGNDYNILKLSSIHKAVVSLRTNMVSAVIVNIRNGYNPSLANTCDLKRNFSSMPFIVILENTDDFDTARLCGKAGMEYVVCDRKLNKLQNILARIIQQNNPVATFKEFDIDVSNCSPLIRKVLDYVRQHYLQINSVAEVANYFYVAPTSLYTLFTRECTFGLKKMIITLKLRHAENLMQNKALSLKEIALLAGFPDQKSFIENFYKKYAVSPRKYRLRLGYHEERCQLSALKARNPKILKKKMFKEDFRNVIYRFE